jgi:hypothetical protein
MQKVTQIELATKWKVSRARISQMVKSGMPLDNEVVATAWARRYVDRRRLRLDDPAPPPPPPRDPRQGDPNWRMTVEETVEVVQTLKDMKAQGCSEETHPRYQAFCDGVRLFHDRGIDLTPEQWEAV